MQFQLPSNLQSKLIAYDPKLKALVKEEKSKKIKKSKYPFGNIPHLIPYEIVSQEDQQNAIDRINSVSVEQRITEFSALDVTNAENNIKAILYHFEDCWYAAWIPLHQKDYIYGFAYAFKNTPIAHSKLSYTVKTVIQNNLNDVEICIVGRSEFKIYKKQITKEDVQNGWDKLFWRAEYSQYSQKCRVIYPVVDRFTNKIKTLISYWEDSYSIFERLACKGIWEVLQIPLKCIPKAESKSWKLYECIGFGTSLDVFNTPFFRKWMHGELQKSIETFNNPDCKTKKEIMYGVERIKKLARNICAIQTIWPDCPIDYFQSNIKMLLEVSFTSYSANITDLVNCWLRKHMPVSFFWTMLNKFYEENANKMYLRSNLNTKTGYCDYRFRDWVDTCEMLNTILINEKTIEPPKRWRITEFHDYVQAEAWKIKNPNEKLPQDLFPEPIKVICNDQSWVFFQPIDTHQLFQWGQAVRNCVGASKTYAENICKKKHFIVLCMVENKPLFTIQLNVCNGLMSVDQIRGIYNSSLNLIAKENYTKAFSKALQKREETLVAV
jgi:hypothetical protein